MTMTNSLRKAVRASGMTLYAIARDTGLKRPSLEKFMRAQRSLRLDKADILARFFGLELKQTRKPARNPVRKARA